MRYLDYEQMVDAALLQVVRQALLQVNQKGLKGDHHFFITFLTQYPGVEFPAHLVAQYPEEITIVLQHEFWNLSVNDNDFSVDVSFGNQPETVKVPFRSIVHVSDPGANFELEFNPEIAEITTLVPAPSSKKTSTEKQEGTGTIISLDQFRKK